MVRIEQLKKGSPDTFDAIRHLVALLDKDYKPLSNEDIKEMLDSSNSFIFVAKTSQNDILPGRKSRVSPLKENVVSASIHPRAKARGFLEASNKIVGMATLVVYRIPYTKKAVLEDLVVDKKFRGQGIGTKLIKAVIAKAKKTGVFVIDFTSRPTRESANHLYKKLGFKQRETNIYRLDLR